MQFSSQFLEVLGDRVVLSDLIAEKVKLKKNGNHWIGLCPFHQEKTPSFYVYNQEGHYHCYGCGAHGDGISYIQETKGFSFPEAVEYLATLFGFVFLSHQIGAFLGVWLGGFLYDVTGAYEAMWWLSILLGLMAALLHWPIKEKAIDRFPVTR